jgi:hypothetical protein
VQGLLRIKPHSTAVSNALWTTLAILRTVFVESGRGALFFLSRPPLSFTSLKTRCRLSVVMSVRSASDRCGRT